MSEVLAQTCTLGAEAPTDMLPTGAHVVAGLNPVALIMIQNGPQQQPGGNSGEGWGREAWGLLQVLEDTAH